jgi:radical SAM-linked protein
VPGSSRVQPVQQAPPVQKLRIRYAKRGRARFTSSRDFSRAFERALRRAGVPMAYSSGFSPHPRISYANAAPTGAASEAEYLEIGLAETCDPAKVREAVDGALPPGLDVLQVVPASSGVLADLLTGSRWQVDLVGVGPEVIGQAITTFLSQESVLVERLTKNGIRAFDARQAVISLTTDGARLELVTAHLTPLVRPDDVLAALGKLVPAFAPTQVPALHRSSQGTLVRETGEILDPLG